MSLAYKIQSSKAKTELIGMNINVYSIILVMLSIINVNVQLR